MIAALYVASDGAYSNLDGVDVWDEARDARTYDGPWPVVAHPPCERWGRMWFGSPRKPDPKTYRLGNDGGCFAAALAAVRRFGGVLEHPADSHAWAAFELSRPPRSGGWVTADFIGGWTCHVEQGHYGHRGRKGTWLYAHSVELPSLAWGTSGQRLCPIMVERHGYLKARRCGITGSLGGKAKKANRAATPEAFRNILLAMARSGLTPSPDRNNLLAQRRDGRGAENEMSIEITLKFDTVEAAQAALATLWSNQASGPVPQPTAPNTLAPAKQANGVHAAPDAAATPANGASFDDLKKAFQGYLARGQGRTAATGMAILKEHGLASIKAAAPEQFGVLKAAFDAAGPENPLGRAS